MVSFMSIWNMLKSFGKKNSQWKNKTIRFACRQVCRTFPYLRSDVGGSSSLEMVPPPLARDTRLCENVSWAEYHGEQVRKVSPMVSVLATTSRTLLLAPTLMLVTDRVWPENCKMEPFLSQVHFGQGLYHISRNCEAELVQRVSHCCHRSGHAAFGRIVKGVWNFGLEKLLNS